MHFLTIHTWALKSIEVVSFWKFTGTYLEFDHEKSHISDKAIQVWLSSPWKNGPQQILFMKQSVPCIWSSVSLWEHLLLEMFCQQRICCSKLITWVHFSVSIHVEGIFSMMGNVLAQDCNRLRASLYWSFNSLNVLFSCLDAKDIGHKPQCRVPSTSVPHMMKRLSDLSCKDTLCQPADSYQFWPWISSTMRLNGNITEYL